MLILVMLMKIKDKKNLLIQIIKGILVFLLFYYSAYIQLIPIALFNLDIHNISDSLNVLLSCFSNIVLAIILWFIYRKELKKEWNIFRNKALENVDIMVKYWVIGLVCMMASNILISILFKTGQAENEQAVQSMITALPWAMLIDAGILAPFVEEVVFRKCFRNVFKKGWLFVLVSGLVFGGMHVVTSSSIVGYLFIIPYSCLGISFALMYDKTDTIFTSVFAHMLHNTLLTLISIL